MLVNLSSVEKENVCGGFDISNFIKSTVDYLEQKLQQIAYLFMKASLVGVVSSHTFIACHGIDVESSQMVLIRVQCIGASIARKHLNSLEITHNSNHFKS